MSEKLKEYSLTIIHLVNMILIRFINSLGWQSIRDIQKTKIVTSMYVWLLIVPVTAKLFAFVDSPGEFNILGRKIILDLELPFSWQVLFFSAFFFVIGNLIYLVFCPDLIKEYKSFAEFSEAGNGKNQLKTYQYRNLNISDAEQERYRELAGIKKEDNSDSLRDNFWNIYSYYCYSKSLIRFICSTSYFIGFMLFSDVAYKNLLWVSHSINIVDFKNKLYFSGVIDFIASRF